MENSNTLDDSPNPNTDDKMSWKPGDIIWTKKPTAAQRLANRVVDSKTLPAK